MHHSKNEQLLVKTDPDNDDIEFSNGSKPTNNYSYSYTSLSTPLNNLAYTQQYTDYWSLFHPIIFSLDPLNRFASSMIKYTNDLSYGWIAYYYIYRHFFTFSQPLFESMNNVIGQSNEYSGDSINNGYNNNNMKPVNVYNINQYTLHNSNISPSIFNLSQISSSSTISLLLNLHHILSLLSHRAIYTHHMSKFL